MGAMLLGGVLALFGTGCSSFETNRGGNQVEVTMAAKAVPEIEAGKDAVTGHAQVNCLFGVFTWGVDHQAVGVNYGAAGGGLFASPADLARNGAAYQACNAAQADLLLAPRYNLTVKDYFVFKIVDCEVKGYPGVLKSIKIVKQ